jgi:hypothetical protein
MQVSVIEVEPQNAADFGKKSPSEDPRSDSFMDSFGEFHAPSPFGSHGPPPMREINENSIVPQRQQWGAQPEFSGFEVPMPPFPQQMGFRPDMMAFRPDWNMQGQQAQRPEMEEQWGRRPETFELHPKSAEFASPSQEVMGEIYGRKFGRMLQDLIAARIQNSLMQQQAQQPNQMMMQNLAMPMRPSFPIESGAQPQAQQEWWNVPQPQQAFPPQAPPAIAPAQPIQEQKPEQPAQQQQVPAQQQNQPGNEQFGQNFPQPQFPVFVSPEDRIQIEPPNGGASWQPPQPQQAQNTEEKQQIPHAILDFMPQPRAWTHQSESAPVPSMAPMVDGEAQQPSQQSVEESNTVNEPHENRIVILKKQPVDGEKHEELGSSQLSDLPLRELQGQLAAAVGALSAQQTQDLQEQQQRFDEEAKNRNSDLQRPQEADLFKSIEQAPKQDAPQLPEIAEEPQKQEQQPVEPAPVPSEHNSDDSEQTVDFPAVKFPNVAPSADAPHAPMNDVPDQHGGIFFQVDEPHGAAPQQEAQHNMAGFV